MEGPDEELTSEAEEQLLKAFEKAKSSAIKIAKRARQSNDPDAIDELEKVCMIFPILITLTLLIRVLSMNHFSTNIKTSL